MYSLFFTIHLASISSSS